MAVYPAQNGVSAQNGEQPIRLPNGLLYPRVEVEQRTHSGDEIGPSLKGQKQHKVKEITRASVKSLRGVTLSHGYSVKNPI